ETAAEMGPSPALFQGAISACQSLRESLVPGSSAPATRQLPRYRARNTGGDSMMSAPVAENRTGAPTTAAFREESLPGRPGHPWYIQAQPATEPAAHRAVSGLASPGSSE